jgi:hypothetical protein
LEVAAVEIMCKGFQSVGFDVDKLGTCVESVGIILNGAGVERAGAVGAPPTDSLTFGKGHFTYPLL